MKYVVFMLLWLAGLGSAVARQKNMKTMPDKVTYLCTWNNLALQKLKSTYLCNKHNWLLNCVKMCSSLHKCHNGSRNILNEKWSLRSTVSPWKWSSWKNCKILDPSIIYDPYFLGGRFFPFSCVFFKQTFLLVSNFNWYNLYTFLMGCK